MLNMGEQWLSKVARLGRDEQNLTGTGQDWNKPTMTRVIVWFGDVPTKRFKSVQVNALSNPWLCPLCKTLPLLPGPLSQWCYSWGALHFDSDRNGDLQCQEFRPRGGRRYIWTWCCMLPSRTVLYCAAIRCNSTACQAWQHPCNKSSIISICQDALDEFLNCRRI